MRTDFTSLFRCPACRAEANARLEGEKEANGHVGEGRLVCLKCETAFMVHDGCADLLLNPCEAVRAEREAQNRIEADTFARDGAPDPEHLRNWVLGLPNSHGDSVEHGPQAQLAVDRFMAQGGGTVLDLGAGLGWTTAMFARAGCRCVAVDVFPTVARCHRIYADSGVSFDTLLADMGDLPLASGQFDCVFANAAIHHSPDLDHTMQEIARVLKPGGLVLFANEPVVGRWERRRVAQFGLEDRARGIRERAYRTTEWRAAFAKAGLSCTFDIVDEGMPEKLRIRIALPQYQPAFRRRVMNLLTNPVLRKPLVRLLSPIAMKLYPFNVFVTGKKKG
jgi:SAM-dependent methyltransferase